jgi:hypothetical protein
MQAQAAANDGGYESYDETRYADSGDSTYTVRSPTPSDRDCDEHGGHQHRAMIVLPPADCADMNTDIMIARARAIL